MKRTLVIALLLLLTACSFNIGDIDNTPTKKVEEYLNNYQSLSSDVVSDLDIVVERETTFNLDEKNKYRKIMKKNFQNMSYKVKDETINGDTAEVEVEINVYDYYKVNKDADNYLLEHRDEFIVDGVYDESKFIDYKLDKMSKNTDKVKFTIYFNLSKDKNGNWSLDEVSEVDEDKILGIYQY